MKATLLPALLALYSISTPALAADVMQQLTGTPNPSMASGEPLRSGATDAARKALMTPPKPTIGGFALQNPPQMYRERSMQPTVMDAPPAGRRISWPLPPRWFWPPLAPTCSRAISPEPTATA